jgi:hypothetical protein
VSGRSCRASGRLGNARSARRVRWVQRAGAVPSARDMGEPRDQCRGRAAGPGGEDGIARDAARGDVDKCSAKPTAPAGCCSFRLITTTITPTSLDRLALHARSPRASSACSRAPVRQVVQPLPTTRAMLRTANTAHAPCPATCARLDRDRCAADPVIGPPLLDLLALGQLYRRQP